MFIYRLGLFYDEKLEFQSHATKMDLERQSYATKMDFELSEMSKLHAENAGAGGRRIWGRTWTRSDCTLLKRRRLEGCPSAADRCCVLALQHLSLAVHSHR